jgi:DNA ligase (NAD+)
MNKLELSKYYLNIELSKFSKKETIDLANVLSYHSNLYYNKENPIISDVEYDLLFKKLEFLENKFKIINLQSEKV